MSAYIVGWVEIKDEKRFAEEYAKHVLGNIAKYGGKLLAAADTVDVREGEWPAGRTILYEFPDMESIDRWYTGPEYHPMIEIRQKYADTTLAFVPGLPPGFDPNDPASLNQDAA